MSSLDHILQKLSQQPFSEQRMPVLFVGHGNPMNAIETNSFSQTWQGLGQVLPKPKAILSVSAHWLTFGDSKACRVQVPKTIHDFSGFPTQLFEQVYPCPGAPELASLSSELSHGVIEITEDWGLDHGTWSVLLQMYPQADIPVYQISIDFRKPPVFHYQLAEKLRKLREKGVLILTSGNVVHNLQKINWTGLQPYDWALEFHSLVKQAVLERDDQMLIDFDKFGSLGKMAHPSYDHYLPLLYSLGLRMPDDDVAFFNDDFDLGSISMLSWAYVPMQ
jgi:4,5-DOPA dioxygenase extradiol